MREVCVIGIGMTKFGELWEKSFRELIAEAGFEAIKDAGITSKEISALYGGNMSAGQFIKQEHIACLIADSSGLAKRNIPSTRVEGADASGSLALRQGIMAVASGYHDIVIVGGVEKMTDVSDVLITEGLASSGDQEWEAFLGANLSSLYAMITRMHMQKYGTTREQLSMVAVKNHFNATKNPKAHFKNEITIEQVQKSSIVAEPLRVLDCAPISDGASAVILCPMEMAKSYNKEPIKIIGSGQSSDTLALHNRRDICTLDAVVSASKVAYKQSGKSPKEINLAEVHDCFTIGEILAIEDLGFCEKGEGGKFTEEGKTSLNGEIPINTSGGLKARGHPLGATGIAQVYEIVQQLRNKAGERQVKNARIGLTHNVGGTGGTAVIHIFEVV